MLYIGCRLPLEKPILVRFFYFILNLHFYGTHWFIICLCAYSGSDNDTYKYRIKDVYAINDFNLRSVFDTKL